MNFDFTRWPIGTRFTLEQDCYQGSIKAGLTLEVRATSQQTCVNDEHRELFLFEVSSITGMWFPLSILRQIESGAKRQTPTYHGAPGVTVDEVLAAQSTGDVVRAEKLVEGYKADEAKARMDLIPPQVLMQLGELYAMGAKKYQDRNWEKGMRWGRCYSALLRHLFKWWMGNEFDPDGQHHLDSVIWNAIALRHYANNPKLYAQYDDRPNPAL